MSTGALVSLGNWESRENLHNPVIRWSLESWPHAGLLNKCMRLKGRKGVGNLVTEFARNERCNTLAFVERIRKNFWKISCFIQFFATGTLAYGCNCFINE